MANWHQNVFTLPISYSTTDLDVRESPDGTMIVSLLGNTAHHVDFKKALMEEMDDCLSIAKEILLNKEAS